MLAGELLQVAAGAALPAVLLAGMLVALRRVLRTILHRASNLLEISAGLQRSDADCQICTFPRADSQGLPEAKRWC